MPLTSILRKLACCVHREQEEAEAREELPLLEPVEAVAMEPGRPYQDFVESKLRQFLRDNNVRSLVKPTQADIRAVATLVLGLAQRYRPGIKLNPSLNRAHMAVNAMQLHLMESGRIKHPFTPSEASPNYVEALIQLADDANWLAREIPLPDHPPPKHPPIYYTIDPQTNRPIPRADSLIRGDYVFQKHGSQLTNISHFHPWLSLRFKPSDFLWSGSAYYSLVLTPENNVEVIIHWPTHSPTSNRIVSLDCPLRLIHFSPQPPSIPGRSRE